MTRNRSRVGRSLVAALLGLALAGIGPASVAGKVPVDHQRHAWTEVCVHEAGGVLSDQPALVCDRAGEPQWTQDQVQRLTRFCVNALGGSPAVRSEYPHMLVACFV